MTDAVDGASFNGLNVLDGSQNAAALDFVSGFNATATGGTVNTINFTTQALVSTTAGGQPPALRRALGSSKAAPAAPGTPAPTCSPSARR